MISFKNSNNDNFNLFSHNIRAGIPFEATGLVSLLRLFLVIKAGEYSKKKVLFITSSEQNSLKYKNDFDKLFEKEAEIFPFQNISMYESVSSNKYDYSEQVRILRKKPDVVIAPIKTLLEKFPE